MRLASTIVALLLLAGHPPASAQCITPPPLPLCTGIEPSVVSDETINKGSNKWYYGPPVVMNSLTLNGGTLVVCGDLTIDKFYMDSGAIYIHPGARFVIGSGIGAGVILRGNSAIYNYGRCEIQRNLSLDNGWASAAKPNLIINALPTSVFRMANQYLVINNPNSHFVNNGSAEFWGIITDNLAPPGAVCLGNSSTVKMAVLINKVADTYVVPSGSACVYVHQYSQFYGRLTPSRKLFACVGSGHTSDAGCIPFGCMPNNWGAAQVFTNCADCGVLAALPVRFLSVTGFTEKGNNRIDWSVSEAPKAGSFIIYRSADGRGFYPVDSIVTVSGQTSYSYIDNNFPTGNNYYMIRHTNQQTGFAISSKTVRIFSDNHTGFSVFPMPFQDKFTISYKAGQEPNKIILTDITGRNLRIRYHLSDQLSQAEVTVLDKISTGIYIVHLRNDKYQVAQTVIRE